MWHRSSPTIPHRCSQTHTGGHVATEALDAVCWQLHHSVLELISQCGWKQLAEWLEVTCSVAGRDLQCGWK